MHCSQTIYLYVFRISRTNGHRHRWSIENQVTQTPIRLQSKTKDSRLHVGADTKIGERIVIGENRKIVLTAVDTESGPIALRRQADLSVLLQRASRSDTKSLRCVRGLGRTTSSSGRRVFGLPKMFSRFRLRSFRDTHGSVRQPTWNSSARHGCCVLKSSRASRC